MFFNGSFAVFCYEYGFKNPLFWKNGGWRLVLHAVFKKNCLMVIQYFGLKHFNMNLNDNVHQCEHFVMDF